MKKLLLAALWLPLMALAQTYPSPTYQNLTVLGTTHEGAVAITGGSISGISPPIPVASGGTGSATANGTALDNITGFASTGFMSRTGAGAYSFTASTGSGSVVLATSPSIASPTVTGAFTATGLVTTADLAAQAANTVLANVTGSSASPTAFAMPSCSTTTSALTYTSGTGFTCAGSMAPLASPAFTGTPTAPTPTVGDNSTKLATTAFVAAAGVVPCTTSTSLGMDSTGTNDNTSALNNWVSSYSSATAACLEFGPGTFKFNSQPTIPLPNAQWSAASSTSNTLATGSKTFTVATGLTIPVSSTAYAYHATTSAGAAQLLTGTVTSYNSGTGALVLNITSCSPSCTGTAYTSWGIVQAYLGGNAFGTITFKGQGIDTTTLLINGAVGGPIFKYAGLIQNALIENMTIATNQAGGQSGPCLSMTNSYPFLGAEQSITTVLNVVCRGADAYGGVDYWTTNFYNQGVSNVNYTGIVAFGDNTGGTHGTGMAFNNPGTYGCVALNSPWSCGENYNIRDSYFDGVNIGISYGVNTQFVGVYNNQFLNGPNGIEVTGAGYQGLTVTGNTFFTTSTAILDGFGIKNIFIANNFFAMNSGAYAINLNPNWAVTITGNQFTPFTSGTSLGAITFPGTSNDISVISGNIISAGGNTVTNGIVLGSSTTSVMVFGNQFSGVTNNVVNSGTGNSVGVTGQQATTSSNTVVNGITTKQ